MTEMEKQWQRDRRAVIIVNPASHNALKRRNRERIDGQLRAEGWTAEWVDTTAAGDATDIAKRAAVSGVPLVLVCGGDGTLNEVINGLAGTETTVAIVPTGTVNLWARELGIKRRKPTAAVEQAIHGERRRIDLGKTGDRYFLSMASYGIDAAVTQGVSNRLKGTVGATAYAAASFREALRFRSRQFVLDLDGERLHMRVLMVIASNTREYAGITQISPEAVVDDGLLDVSIFEGHGRINIALHALRVLLRLHKYAKRVHFRRVRRLEIAGVAPMPLQLDGELIHEAQGEVVCVPGALWVAVPPGFRSPLFSDPPAP
jgi:YegS/Rv2252/BmrU family lipid kinase